ncbi:MAG TPA: hypothetical protein EYG02_02995 [Henriciella marina]|uniref:hypothetical protein n=1 Tax=Henriciella sp. TaxID=1968823 RepID=UPI0017AE87B1|nr:hypothetical protein [Henriciella sp.]HIG22290.1 hypothetical protein [Henriciella sp.]HIK63981.1 hypothetical protein [Henriciella marina]
MSFLILIAFALLALAVALFFGPHFITYGPDGFRDLVRHGDARMICLFLVGAIILAILLPGQDPALISRV